MPILTIQTEMTAARSSRAPGLDLLRALAVLMVLVFHFSNESNGTMFSLFGRYGWMGVDLFFVLSGYLIGNQLFKAIAMGKPLTFGNFLRRRLMRTLPNFLAVLAVYYSFPLLRERKVLPDLWRFLTFTQNIELSRAMTGAFSHAWSLCVEEQFYLVLPLILFLFFRKGATSRRVIGLIVGLFIFGLFARVGAWLWLVQPFREIDKHFGSLHDQYLYYPIYARLDGLLVGIGLALIKVFRRATWNKLLDKGYYALGLAALSMGVACFLSDSHYSAARVAFLYPAVSFAFGGLLITAVSPSCHLSRWRNIGVEFIATLSFGIYLVQKLVFHWNESHLPMIGVSPYSYTGFAMTFASCVFVATVLHLLVERPVMQLRERLDSPRLPVVSKSSVILAPTST